MIPSKVIVITGSIATGKSAVTEIIKKNGFEVIDADEIGHEVLEKDFITKQIGESFGGEFLKKGSVDRARLSKYVFQNQEKIEILNSIMHQAIFDEINYRIKNSTDKVIFVDMPLYYEIENKLLDYGFKSDEVWLVYVSKKIQIERLMKRDCITSEVALQKINSQIDIELKKDRADSIIENEKSLEELEERVNFLIKNI
ncbi:dephospho-CoA kinase [Peptoniphilus asaccharolyticus]